MLPELQDLSAVFDVVDVGLIVLDGGARVIAWNQWMSAASGIAATATLGRSIEEIFSAAANPRLLAVIADALTVGTSGFLVHSLHGQLFDLKTRTGKKLLHNVAVRSIDGTPHGGAPHGDAPLNCLIQIFDVTVVTERDRLLRERQNARYDAVVNSAPDPIITLDVDGLIQLANPAAVREFGYPATALIDHPISVLFGDQPDWQSAWQTLSAGGRLTRPVELVVQRKDGSTSYVEVSASNWASDARIFTTAILRDVNERRRAEHALRNLNTTLEQRVAKRTADRDRMWRLSLDVMLVFRPNGLIRASNPAWRELLGWNQDAPPRTHFIETVARADWLVLEAAMRDLSSSGAPRRFELGINAANGSIRRISWSAGAADGLIQAVGRDVTAERAAEAALREAEDALRQSQKMEAIGQLTGGIAHDFNNLLTGVMGSMEMLKRRIAAKRYGEVDQFIDAAVTSAERAAALTHRLLAFARRQSLDPQSVDVIRLIEGMADLLRRSLGEQVQFRIVPGVDIWPVHTDANQLENALLNLAINARDAMPDGGRLTISLANLCIAPSMPRADPIDPGDYTIISVSDTGVGMSADVAAKAFDPFFTTKPIGQGTGLGLSMIYGFAKQSRGHVRIESAEGQGTTVKLFLPRYRGTVPAMPETIIADTPYGSGEVVLLVEDEPSVRLLISEVLSELGYGCLEAEDAKSAIPIIASKTRLDLMITDVGLPVMNGRQLAEIARQHRPELKVLFVTGYAEHATTRAGFLAAGMGIVIKPFALDALAIKIREMLGA
jgi:PAS domain S-box-containing protein